MDFLSTREDIRILGSVYNVLDPMAGHWLWYHSRGGIPAGGIHALHPVPETLRFTEKCPVRNTAELNNNMDPYSLTTGAPPLLQTSIVSKHRVVRRVCIRHLAASVSAAPRLPALRRSLIHMDIKESICPLIRQRRPQGERGLGDLGDKVALNIWSRFDSWSVPKSSSKPTARVWQGGSSEGQIWGQGCVQSSTQTAGVFSRGTRCVCVCVCVDRSMNQRGPLTLNGILWIPWRKSAI